MRNILSIIVLVSFFLVGCGGDKTVNNYYSQAESPKSSLSSSLSSVASSSSSSSSAAATGTVNPLGFETSGPWNQYVPSTSYDVKVSDIIVVADTDGDLTSIEIEERWQSDTSIATGSMLYSDTGGIGFQATSSDSIEETGNGAEIEIHSFQFNIGMSKGGNFWLPVLAKINGDPANPRAHRFSIKSYTFNGKKYDANIPLTEIITTNQQMPTPKVKVNFTKENTVPGIGKIVFSPDENGVKWEVVEINFDIKMSGIQPKETYGVYCLGTLPTLCQEQTTWYTTYAQLLFPGSTNINTERLISNTIGTVKLEYYFNLLNYLPKDGDMLSIRINKVIFRDQTNNNIWFDYTNLVNSSITVVP